MINNKNNLLMIISLSLVVAVVASIATINITGEVIRLKEDKLGKYKVYTAGEIDKKLSEFIKDPNEISDCNILSEEILSKIRELKLSGYFDENEALVTKEGEKAFRNDLVIVSHKSLGEGYQSFILKVQTISKTSGESYSSDKVEFVDILTGTTYKGVLTAKGIGEIYIGKPYDFTYEGTTMSDENYVILDYPDTIGNKKLTYDCW